VPQAALPAADCLPLHLSRAAQGRAGVLPWCREVRSVSRGGEGPWEWLPQPFVFFADSDGHGRHARERGAQLSCLQGQRGAAEYLSGLARAKRGLHRGSCSPLGKGVTRGAGTPPQDLLEKMRGSLGGLSRVASAAARVCSQGSPAPSLFPDALGFRHLRQHGCAGEGPAEDYVPEPFPVQQSHSGGKEPGTLQPGHLPHLPAQLWQPAALPVRGCCPALAAAAGTARQSPHSPGMQPWALGASGLWHQLPALTLSALLPPSPRPGTMLEGTPTALSATGTSKSRCWDGCWDVSSSSYLPVSRQAFQLHMLFVSSNNSWRIKRVRQVGVGFIPRHTDTS